MCGSRKKVEKLVRAITTTCFLFALPKKSLKFILNRWIARMMDLRNHLFLEQLESGKGHWARNNISYLLMDAFPMIVEKGKLGWPFDISMSRNNWRRRRGFRREFEPMDRRHSALPDRGRTCTQFDRRRDTVWWS